MELALKWQNVKDKFQEKFGEQRGQVLFNAYVKNKGIDCQKEVFKDLKFEFTAPIIKEKVMGEDGKVVEKYTVQGTAVHATISRNGVKYVAEELEKATPTLKSKPILDSHNQDSIKNILGVVEDAWYDAAEQAVKFKGDIKNKDAQKQIDNGLVKHVSIGARARELVKETKDKVTTLVAKGLEFLELSLVAVPGIPTATLTHALSEALKLEEDKMAEDINVKEDERVKELEKQLKAVKEQNETLLGKVNKNDDDKKKEDEEAEEKLKSALAEKKDLQDKLEAIEKEKHSQLVKTVLECEKKAGLVKEGKEKEEEEEKLSGFSKETLEVLLEKVKDVKTETKTPTSKGKAEITKVNEMSDIESGDLVVERGRNGISFWEMPKEGIRINAPNATVQPGA